MQDVKLHESVMGDAKSLYYDLQTVGSLKPFSQYRNEYFVSVLRMYYSDYDTFSDVILNPRMSSVFEDWKRWLTEKEILLSASLDPNYIPKL